MFSPAFRRARWFAFAALLLGIVGQGLLSLFVFLNGLDLWPRAVPSEDFFPWLMNAALIFIFAIQHSGMARAFLKERIRRFLPDLVERPLYVACSGLTTLLLVLAWQPLPGPDLWRGPVWISGINFLALVGLAWCFWWQDPLRFLGLGPFLTRPQMEDTLVIRGPYRWVRHPLMLGVLLHLWAHPVMSMTLVFLSGGLTFYILIAVQLEERDLVRKFGPDYESYRRRVPAVIPWRIFSS